MNLQPSFLAGLAATVLLACRLERLAARFDPVSRNQSANLAGTPCSSSFCVTICSLVRS
jgi:hypothetical protein